LYTPGAEKVQRIYVKADAKEPYDGKSWATAFSDLQDALSIAQPNTEIWVAAGVYRPDRGTGARTASFHLKNGVRLLGGFSGIETSSYQRDPNNNETILSGDLKGDDGPNFINNDENSYHVVIASRTDPNTFLNGFTITNGNANGPKGPKGQGDKQRYGGGMYNDGGSPTLMNCVFRYNSAIGYGGGTCMRNGSRPTLINCKFMRNLAGAGGAVAMIPHCSPTLIDCKFIGNSAIGRNVAGRTVVYACGGGVYNDHSTSTLTNCTFTDNTADQGGGMYYSSSLSAKLTNCGFVGNSADSGGGMSSAYGSSPELINCRFIGNTARDGGGMGNDHGSKPTITNCIFSRNLAKYGGGMQSQGGEKDRESNRLFYSNLTLVNCTFRGNKADVNGGGILNGIESKLTLTNCILWSNSDSGGMDESAQIDNTRSDQTLAIDHCCVQDWSGRLGGVGNLGADPLFVDVDGPDNKIGTEDDNLRLGPRSLCINVGDNSALPADTSDLDSDGDPNEPIPFDLDGKPRLLNGTVDIGAYESG